MVQQQDQGAPAPDDDNAMPVAESPAEPRRRMKRVVVLSIVPITVGILGLVFSFWQYLRNAPNLVIEIQGIERHIEADVSLDIVRYPKLRLFISQQVETMSIDAAKVNKGTVSNPDTISLNQLERIIVLANEEMQHIPGDILKEKNRMESLEVIRDEFFTDEGLYNHFRLKRLKDLNEQYGTNVTREQLERMIGPSEQSLEELEKNNPEHVGYQLLLEISKQGEENYDTLRERLEFLRANTPVALRVIDRIRNDTVAPHATFHIGAVLTNSGGTAISAGGPSLLRVYISPGNYVDLKLMLAVGASSEIPAHGTQIVEYISEEMGEMTDTDQNLIETYLGQRAHGILFIEDTQSTIHHSNRIPFAEGLYQKRIYDRLATEASRSEHAEQD